MSEPKTQMERNLEQLGKRVRNGWAKKHPVDRHTFAAVRQAIRQQWEQERGKTEQASPASKPKEQKNEPSQQTTQPPSEINRKQDLGHSH